MKSLQIMNSKKIIYLVVVISLCLAPVVFGQGIKNPLGVSTFKDLLLKIADGVGTLVASLAVIMLIVSGIMFLLSSGSPERIGTAKKALTYAIIGIVIGLAAKSIVQIIQNLIGA